VSPTLSELAARHGVSTPTMHGHVMQLIKKGWLKRSGTSHRNFEIPKRGVTVEHVGVKRMAIVLRKVARRLYATESCAVRAAKAALEAARKSGILSR
ncbi:MAG: hypothetical protein V3T70_05530, partial [Phycisphaerae bacterium]